MKLHMVEENPAHGLPAIDWCAPWLAPLAALGAQAEAKLRAGASVTGALNALIASGAAPDPGVHFVPQSELPLGWAYEQFIYQRAQVPTRDNLHDFFNGLVWLQLPRSKRRLNQIHGSAIAAAGVGQRRGPLRDALTLLDENGALLLAPDELWQALLTRQWWRLFVELRPLWQEARLVLFGHALMEKMVEPRKSITAHVYRAQSAINLKANDDLDAWLAAELGAAHLASKPFAPLPVLGLPGWWSQNLNFSFYDDPEVFRPFAHTACVPAGGLIRQPPSPFDAQGLISCPTEFS